MIKNINMCLLYFYKIPNIHGDVLCGLGPEFPEMRHSIITTKANALTLQLNNKSSSPSTNNIESAHRLRAIQSGTGLFNQANLVNQDHREQSQYSRFGFF